MSNRLPVLAVEIRRAHADVQEAAKTAAERALAAGAALEQYAPTREDGDAEQGGMEGIMARKTVTTPENKTKVLDLIADGLSVRAICRQDDMPGRQTLYRWIADDKDFGNRYARARRAEYMFDEIIEIADNSNGEVNRDRLRVDARKWKLSKMQPKKYGDRLDLNHGGDIVVKISGRDSDL